MTIFATIRERIVTHQQQQALSQQSTTAGALAGLNVGAGTAAAQIDVEKVLEDIDREKGDPDLNWRSSIVDLMKLLDLDSSLSNRAELATELGYQREKNGSAEMNIWLHRRVMEELEKTGGRVSESLKD